MSKRIKFIVLFVIAIGILWAFFGRREINYPYGRDTMCVINDGKYQVLKAGRDDVILRCFNDIDSNVVLKDIRKFKTVKKNTYIYADNGFAVVYSDNTCKVFLTYDEEEMEQGYVIDEDGGRYDFMMGIRFAYPDVKLLNSFDEFTEQEQKELIKLQEKTEKEDMEKEKKAESEEQ